MKKIENFEFYNKELSEFEFLNKFYVWETEFWGKDDKNVEIEKIETIKPSRIPIVPALGGLPNPS